MPPVLKSRKTQMAILATLIATVTLISRLTDPNLSREKKAETAQHYVYAIAALFGVNIYAQAKEDSSPTSQQSLAAIAHFQTQTPQRAATHAIAAAAMQLAQRNSQVIAQVALQTPPPAAAPPPAAPGAGTAIPGTGTSAAPAPTGLRPTAWLPATSPHAPPPQNEIITPDSEGNYATPGWAPLGSLGWIRVGPAQQTAQPTQTQSQPAQPAPTQRWNDPAHPQPEDTPLTPPPPPPRE